VVHNGEVQIRIEGSDLPGRACGPSPDEPGGYHNIQVGIQRRDRPGDWLGLIPADSSNAVWTVDCTTHLLGAGVDLKGPYIQGSPGGRFLYLSRGTVDEAGTFTMFRRAKLMLDAVPPAVIGRAVDRGLLVGRLGLTDAKGHPLCAAVRPPLIQWSAEKSL
jgi:hypothetical protein